MNIEEEYLVNMFKDMEDKIRSSTYLNNCTCRNDEIKVNAYIVKLKQKIVEQQQEIFRLKNRG